ncbi:Citrate transporter [Alkalidesulfovibrio alkalitolerans DSM 16529]|uniref:Citrate transporter n=1 Tax=Alkalidesulfovibrio alkalitolerans DSM 16529 TaxID=1121439 RepID=S7UL28_9BACT|nr:SLC13 family permease [Alkalidesulfovibrio alkalitolerans]EPR33033.1 Citrate transporter [Alkalidesulfovibrio alkalitolerans DSM 16529]
MTHDQMTIIAILVAAMGMFIWGRWRHDMVAGGALLACVFAGIVPGAEAFEGFGHPAVITVVCVLVLSHGLQITGAVDELSRRVLPSSSGQTVSIAALTGLAAVLSAFMNNVGAMALLMPVAVKLAARQGLTPGKVLMPLAFGSILGGTMTLIGTPPNLIVSGFRNESGLGGFGMFDFSPVGASVTLAGLVFISLIGWRLVPAREQSDTGDFDTAAYTTEVRITEDSKAVGKSLREVERMLDETDALVVGLVRGGFRLSAPYPGRILRDGDILVIQSEPKSLSSILSGLGLKLEENVPPEPEVAEAKDEEEATQSDTKGDEAEKAVGEGESRVSGNTSAEREPEEGGKEKNGNGKDNGEKAKHSEILIQEMVAMPGGMIIGRSARDMELRTRFGINLLAISRQGHRSIRRLRSTPIQGGDVLLMQGAPEVLSSFASEFGCVPLAARDVHVPGKGQAVRATLVMAAAIAAAALGLAPVAIAFAAGVLALMAMRIVSLRSVYQAVDWPVIVLLGAMLPVAGAMASTGAADLIARFLLENVAKGQAVFGLAVILAATMLMTDFMNNAATAAVMCPIALSTAAQLNVNADSFLMAVAIGSSCAFLTPIGHQNNTLILGPGGFRFGDYWRMGLPTDILVIAVGLPMLLLVWPL